MVVSELTSPSHKLLLAREDGGGKYQPTQGNEASRHQGSQTTNWGGGGGWKVKRYFEVARRNNKAMNDGSEITRQQDEATRQCDEAMKQHEEAT